MSVVVMMVLVAVVVMTTFLQGVVEDARELEVLVKVWRDAGPHTTFMGKVREYLASAWWLGPLKVAPARDPLAECGVPVDIRWRDVVPLLLGLKERLACMHRHTRLADDEHRTFVVMVLLSVGSLVVVGVCGALVVARCCWLRKTARLGKADAGNAVTLRKTETCDKLVKLENVPVVRCIVYVMYNVMTRRDLMQGKVGSGHLPVDSRGVDHVTGKLLALPPPPPVTVDDVARRAPAHGPDLKGNTPPKADVVRRSLLVPRRFREKLEGPEECFLHYLRGHYTVDVFSDPKRGKLHIKGAKANVMECYTAVRALLAVWRGRECQEVMASRCILCITTKETLRLYDQ